MFFKSRKCSPSPYQIEEKSKQDDTFNKNKRTHSELKEDTFRTKGVHEEQRVHEGI